MKIFVLILAFALQAKAFTPEVTLDGKEAHGGNGVVCRDSHKHVKSVRLMDFYEGEILYGVKIVPSKQKFDEQALAIAEALDASTYIPGPDHVHVGVFKDMIASLRILPDGVTLKPVDDSKDILIPKDCSVEQAALYTPDGLIHIVKDFWDHMSETDKAGLIAHEALFFLARRAGETDSIRARMINAYAFSKFQFVPAVPVLTGESYQCGGGGYASSTGVSFVANVHADNSVEVYYTYLPNRGFVYSELKSTTGYPIEFFPFANGRQSQFGRTGFNGCVYVGTTGNFENYNTIQQCADLKDPANMSYQVGVAPRDDASAFAAVPFYCTRMP